MFVNELSYTNQKVLLEELNIPFELDYKLLLYCIIYISCSNSLNRECSALDMQCKQSQKKTQPQGFILLFRISAIPAH